MKTPLIGLTLDYENNGQYSSTPWYALRKNYFDAVQRAGGLPVAVPYQNGLADNYLNKIDGLIITGGNFDINPELFGSSIRHQTTKLKANRTTFELAVTRGAIDRNIPLLGICGGEQLINVALGGTLIQHIPDEVDNALEHEQKIPKSYPSHAISIKRGTLLYSILDRPKMLVNTAHHQSVATTADPVIVNSVASDGVIEGIEHPEKRFCLGVQWHPEYGINDGDLAIFKALVDASK